MPIILYTNAGSPSGRAVIILAEALGLQLEIKGVDYAKGETTTPEFLKMNPLHTIPVLDDNGVFLGESHAMLPYLVAKYGKDDSLYPKDIVKRAFVDAKLHFDTGYAFMVLKRTYRAHLDDGQTEPITAKQNQEFNDVYDFTNTFLESNKWIAGDSLTIADISLFSTITSLDTMLPIDDSKYPNIRRWLNDAAAVPFFKGYKPGLDAYRAGWEATIAR